MILCTLGIWEMNSVSGEVTLSQFGLLVKPKWESIRGIKLAILT